jgi:hypothetical protein
LCEALVGEPSTDSVVTAGLETRLHEFVQSAPRAEVVSLLDLVGGPLVLPDHGGLVSPHGLIVLSVVHRFPEPDLVPLLEQAEIVCPTAARPQLVRSTFEIAARAGSEQALAAGLAMARRLVRDRVPIGGMDTPLYWLEVQPIFPVRVALELPRLAAYPPLRDHAERVRAAYAAAYPESADSFGSSFVRAEDLRGWAAAGDERLVSAVISHVGAVEGAAGALGYEAVVALAEPLVVAWAAFWVEAEILNGGYNQYFWNSSGRYAIEAVRAFETVGSPDYANIQRSAIVTFMDSEPDLRPFRDDGSLEAFSASYELKTFDQLDDAFLAVYDTTTVTDLLVAWLSRHLDEIAAAIGVTE